MELSEVRCSSASEEMYTINKTPSSSGNSSGSGSARPKRLLWQNAVRHITEQRFIHEQGGGGTGGIKDDPFDPIQDARKQSAGRTSVGDRHNNGGTKVFPERASSDLGFLQIDCAPSNSDFFLNWGYTYRGVIFPTLRNAFKSRDLERLYQRYFLGQRRKSVVVMNILDVVTKLTLLVLHLTLASTPMDPIKGTLLGFFTGIEVVICALVVVRKDTTSHSYLQYSGVVTWVAMATQILAAGLGYGLLGDGVGYVLFTLFATYSMLPLPLTWAILAGLFTSGLHILVQLLISESAQLFTNQASLRMRGNLWAAPGLFFLMKCGSLFMQFFMTAELSAPGAVHHTVSQDQLPLLVKIILP
ncbi:Adenylate cyclase type 8 [Xenoophorus captivus]|uniref:Adenylate cyclase type 8 n=1 Tax=Xenoophorus captivus TaxID=1517983 RepID=A0ABV0QYB6_9TELE